MHINLTMLLWSHGPCIYVHVRIYLDSSDLQTGGLEEKTGGRG